MDQSWFRDSAGRHAFVIATVVLAISMATPVSSQAQDCRLTTYSTSTTVGSNVTISTSDISTGSQCQFSITGVTDPSNGNTRISGGSVIFSPTATGYANFFIKVSGSGSVGGRTSVSINVESDDPPDSGDPPVTSDDHYSVREGQTVAGDVLLNDSDPDGDPLSASRDTRPSSGRITNFDSDGDFTFDTDGDFNHLHSNDNRSVSFDYTADDGTDGSTSGTVHITINGVNDSPWAKGISVSVGEDRTASISVADKVGDSDHSDDALTASVAGHGGPDHGSVGDQGDDLILKYEPDDEFSGSDEFRYEVSDGSKTATATVSITVNARNDTPTASGAAATTEEDSTVTIDVSDEVQDPDDGMTQLSATPTGTPSHGRVKDSNPDDLKFAYEPEADYNGSDSFSYQVTDGDKVNSASVDVDVVAVPDVILQGGAAMGFEPRDGLNTGLIGTPVGVIKFTADSQGDFSSITLTNDSPGIKGVEELRVYPSNSAEIDANESPIVKKEVDTDSAPSKINLDLKGETITESPRYLFITAEVTESADAKVTFTIESPSDVSFGSRGTVDQSESAPFPIKLWKGDAQLPVELANFEARGTERGISLKWRTASEQNNAGFEVQRRVVGASQLESPSTGTERSTDTDGAGWQTVGRLEGAGTTDEPQSYHFTDNDLPYAADSVGYRLRQLDTDGSTHFTDPVTVARDGVDRVTLKETYPNPASGSVIVRFAVPSSAEGEVRVRLYDVLGRAVRTLSGTSIDGRAERQIDVSTLSSGVYILRLRVGSTTRTRRLTVLR